MSTYDTETRIQALESRCADLELTRELLRTRTDELQARCTELELTLREAASTCEELARAVSRASEQIARQDHATVLVAQALLAGIDNLTATERRELKRVAGEVQDGEFPEVDGG